MLYKFFEGTCLKNRKKCWERLYVNWFRGQDSMNKQGFWYWSGCQSLVPLALEYQRFASIRAWADENHKLFSLERAIWLWRCRLPCLYFGEEILFEKKKKGFFRKNVRIFWIVGHRSINFKRTGVSLIVSFKDFGRCRQHLGNYAVSSRRFQGISLHFRVQANSWVNIKNLIAALSNDFCLQLLNFFLTLQVYLVRANKVFF